MSNGVAQGKQKGNRVNSKHLLSEKKNKGMKSKRINFKSKGICPTLVKLNNNGESTNKENKF